MHAAPPQSILLGGLTRQTLVTAQGQVFVDQPGGNLLYAAAAAALWEAAPGLVARVGADYPPDWVEDFSRKGFDTDGVQVAATPIDLRHFLVYRGIDQPQEENPIRYFADLGQPLPKSLLGYSPPASKLDDRKARQAGSLRDTDIPPTYTGSRAAHFCALDYVSQNSLIPILRDMGVQQISVAASSGYMHPNFRNDVPSLVNGLSAFVATEAQMRTLFSGRTHDLWEMAGWLAAQNCGCVVIQRGEKGHLLAVGEGSQRYQIPSYPNRPVDITGREAAFGGGLLAGLVAGASPLEATLRGAVAASIAVEGSGPFYAMESSLGLAEARLQALQDAVRVV